MVLNDFNYVVELSDVVLHCNLIIQLLKFNPLQCDNY